MAGNVDKVGADDKDADMSCDSAVLNGKSTWLKCVGSLTSELEWSLIKVDKVMK